MKNLSIPLPDKLHDLFVRIAKSDNRRLNDFSYLILAEGLRFYFENKEFYLEKLVSDLSEEEVKQFHKNNDLKNSTMGWDHLSMEEKKKQGYVNVENFYDVQFFVDQLEALAIAETN